MNRALIALLCVLVGCALSASAADCPDDAPRVECFVAPCDHASCTNYPNANCVDDYCGGCNARFYDDDQVEVTDSC